MKEKRQHKKQLPVSRISPFCQFLFQLEYSSSVPSHPICCNLLMWQELIQIRGCHRLSSSKLDYTYSFHLPAPYRKALLRFQRMKGAELTSTHPRLNMKMCQQKTRWQPCISGTVTWGRKALEAHPSLSKCLLSLKDGCVYYLLMRYSAVNQAFWQLWQDPNGQKIKNKRRAMPMLEGLFF